MTQSSAIAPLTIASAAIPVLKGDDVVAQAQVDEQDRDRIAAHTWRLTPRGYVTTFVRGIGRQGRGRKGPGHYETMHRMVLGLMRGDGIVVDHVSGDKLDNRRANLFVGTQSDNQQNRAYGYGTSSHRGVGWDASRRKWIAYGKLPGKPTTFLGRFDDERQAARVAAAFREQHMAQSREARSSRAGSS